MVVSNPLAGNESLLVVHSCDCFSYSITVMTYMLAFWCSRIQYSFVSSTASSTTDKCLVLAVDVVRSPRHLFHQISSARFAAHLLSLVNEANLLLCEESLCNRQCHTLFYVMRVVHCLSQKPRRLNAHLSSDSSLLDSFREASPSEKRHLRRRREGLGRQRLARQPS